MGVNITIRDAAPILRLIATDSISIPVETSVSSAWEVRLNREVNPDMITGHRTAVTRPMPLEHEPCRSKAMSRNKSSTRYYSPEERARRGRVIAAYNLKHGHCVRGEDRPPEYNVWVKIRKRCLNPSDKDFCKYGARGITVCDEWQQSFEAFRSDMGPRPSKAHSIERKDNDGPYAPWNCRWATAKEQAENRRSSVILEHDGRRLTQMEWSRITGIGVTTICYRLSAGWSVADALTIPTSYRRKGV